MHNEPPEVLWCESEDCRVHETPAKKMGVKGLIYEKGFHESSGEWAAIEVEV